MRLESLALPLLLRAAGVLANVHHHHGSSVVSSFKWSRPIPYDGSDPMGVDVQCKVERSFHAELYKLRELQSPSPWSGKVLDLMSWHPYPGSWDGVDEGGDDREFIIMEYKDVPEAVREWVANAKRAERNNKSKWWMYGVFEKPLSLRSPKAEGEEPQPSEGAGAQGGIPDEDKVLMFAPAALYETLPLWVGKDSPCEAEMLDITKYSSYPRDKTVIAWPVEYKTNGVRGGSPDLDFKIAAYYVLETDHGKAWREMWEKMQAQDLRRARKEQREQRKAAREQVGRPKDEL